MPHIILYNANDVFQIESIPATLNIIIIIIGSSSSSSSMAYYILTNVSVSY